MKAILYRDYGSPDVLRLEDVEKPAPGDDEVLVRVRAASVNPLDWHVMRGEPRLMRVMSGLRKPKDARLGVDLAGEVEAVGKSVTRFDQVRRSSARVTVHSPSMSAPARITWP